MLATKNNTTAHCDACLYLSSCVGVYMCVPIVAATKSDIKARISASLSHSHVLASIFMLARATCLVCWALRMLTYIPTYIQIRAQALVSAYTRRRCVCLQVCCMSIVFITRNCYTLITRPKRWAAARGARLSSVPMIFFSLLLCASISSFSYCGVIRCLLHLHTPICNHPRTHTYTHTKTVLKPLLQSFTAAGLRYCRGYD